VSVVDELTVVEFDEVSVPEGDELTVVEFDEVSVPF